MSCIFGIDVQKGCIRSGMVHPRFSLVVVVDGVVVSEENSVSIPRLFRRMRQEMPQVLAVDSVQEIAADDAGLFRFMASMPAETALVQVTGDGVSMASLPVVAARYNLKFDKTNPLEEARVSALIASYGGGSEVLAFEGVTSVVVSRGRSLGRGGWSQNRYVRKIHGGVRTKAREIEDKLKDAGLSYSVTGSEAFGGSSRVVFEVSALRSRVPISPRRFGDVQVHVVPKRREKVLFVSRVRKNPYVIVGVDPGTTVGVAVLSLSGELLHLESVRAQSPAELISVVSSVGVPVLVATDKAKMPAGVEKIRRVFGAVSWVPKKDVLIKEKYAVADGFSFADDHQRDSLAAALMAYRSYLPKFENVGRRVPEGVDVDLVRANIIRGKPVFESVLLDDGGGEGVCGADSLSSKPVSEVFDEKDLEIIRLEGEVQKLRKLCAGLSSELESKDKALRSLQRRLSSVQDEQFALVLSSEVVASRDRELEQTKKALRKEERRGKNLRLRIERMKRYIALSAGDGCLALKVLQQLSRDEIRGMDDEMGVCEGDILYILKIDGWGKSALNDLTLAHVRAVILPKQTYVKARDQHLLEEFYGIGVPLLSGALLSPRVRGKIGVVNEDAFVLAEEEWRTLQGQYQKEMQSSALNGMVAEYQVQRKRDVLLFGIDNSGYVEQKVSPAVKVAGTGGASGVVCAAVKDVGGGVASGAVRVAAKDAGTGGASGVVRAAVKDVGVGGDSGTVSASVLATALKEPDEEKAGADYLASAVSEKPDVLMSVLNTYRKERQKELNRNG